MLSASASAGLAQCRALPFAAVGHEGEEILIEDRTVDRIAAYAANLAYEDLTDAAIHEAKRRMM